MDRDLQGLWVQESLRLVCSLQVWDLCGLGFTGNVGCRIRQMAISFCGHAAHAFTSWTATSRKHRLKVLDAAFRAYGVGDRARVSIGCGIYMC